MPHSLTKEEIGRYSRQLLVNDFGVPGQESLKTTKALIVGAGGLGCPVATYLAGAGIGTLGIVDYDKVAVDNLHRQVAHSEATIDKLKTESLKESIQRLNHLVNVVCHNVLLDSAVALEIVKNYDIVCDCSDNAATRYLINDACVLLGIPLVSGSALRWEGQLTVYNYKNGPCYRCLFPQPPNAALVTNCSEGGVLGPVVGMIGSMQALEVIKIAAGIESSFSGKLFLFDGLSGRNRTVALRPKAKDCAVCGENPTVKKLIDYEVFCGAGPNDKVQTLHVLKDEDRVSVEEFSAIRSESKQPILVDTRPPNEFAIASFTEANNITLDELRRLPSAEIEKRLGLINEKSANSDVFVICHRGNDSQLAVEILKEKLNGQRIKDIRGGYQRWAEVIDQSFPEY